MCAQIKFLECPICRGVLSFAMPDQIVKRYKESQERKTEGAILYGKVELFSPRQINFHYFIVNSRIEMIIREQNADHVIYVLLDSHFDIRDSFALYSKEIIKEFAKNLGIDGLNPSPDQIEEFIGAIYCDELHKLAKVH